MLWGGHLEQLIHSVCGLSFHPRSSLPPEGPAGVAASSGTPGTHSPAGPDPATRGRRAGGEIRATKTFVFEMRSSTQRSLFLQKTA